MELFSVLAGPSAVLSMVSALASFAPPEGLQVPAELRARIKSFEPSGALYLEDLDRFLIISDDTTDANAPWTFLADAQGRVAPDPVPIIGVPKIMDLESQSQDEKGDLYFLTSQSMNKDGETKKARNLFVRATRRDTRIEARQTLELRPLVLAATHLPETALDIESHFIWDGELYVGLKNPQPAGRALILKLGRVDRLFRERTLPAHEVEAYATLDFRGVTGESDLISDLARVGDQLMISTVVEDPHALPPGGNGRVWRYDLSRRTLHLEGAFPGQKPEGIAWDARAARLWMVFDEGLNPGLFTSGRL